jgi:hypothetical protein
MRPRRLGKVGTEILTVALRVLESSANLRAANGGLRSHFSLPLVERILDKSEIFISHLGLQLDEAHELYQYRKSLSQPLAPLLAPLPPPTAPRPPPSAPVAWKSLRWYLGLRNRIDKFQSNLNSLTLYTFQVFTEGRVRNAAIEGHFSLPLLGVLLDDSQIRIRRYYSHFTYIRGSPFSLSLYPPTATASATTFVRNRLGRQIRLRIRHRIRLRIRRHISLRIRRRKRAVKRARERARRVRKYHRRVLPIRLVWEGGKGSLASRRNLKAKEVTKFQERHTPPSLKAVLSNSISRSGMLIDSIREEVETLKITRLQSDP